jgi:hypothetical protein
MLSIQERLALSTEAIEGHAWQWACMLRSAMPGIVVSFDPVAQTCVVQPAIQEIVLLPPPTTAQGVAPGTTQNIPTSVSIKPLQDVPIIMMRVPGWSITLPIVENTECLLIFADSCIDGWWANGGINAQYDRRRHDLSDAFALFGPWSQPNKLSNYSTTSMQLRSDDSSVVIDLSIAGVKITGPAVSAIATGGTAQGLMTAAWDLWFITNIEPFLISKGYAGPAPPTNSVTTVLKGE